MSVHEGIEEMSRGTARTNKRAAPGNAGISRGEEQNSRRILARGSIVLGVSKAKRLGMPVINISNVWAVR